eukprot:CAMPEP_0197178816 /NCGR_PEP_ID=MMETSP1423-20130617/3978_1 /TAXON_ID=476441 /ORGANISM="Pseudo-nitzschia heimii, Strain UNC1101" /LENGTH=221 /DNA_ID=CAMNT_0042628629 /DNA_START=36 /DNA_END=701 /DNA_ORIENTATION=+
MTRKKEPLAPSAENECYRDEDKNDNARRNHGRDRKSNSDAHDDDDDENAIEKKYERMREEQTNTGVIAALLGGFALTNAWELELHEQTDPKTIDVAAYCMSIIAVHCCTCSALISAFLYRTMTLQPDHRRGVAWVEHHAKLAAIPWIKFLFGTMCYVTNVLLVAWSTLEDNLAPRIIMLFGGMMSITLVLYTCYVTMIQVDRSDDADTKSSPAKKDRSTRS